VAPEPTPAPTQNALTGIPPEGHPKPDAILTVGVNAGPALASLDRMRRALEAAQTPPSPAFSFRGWLFSKWLVKNKAALKLLLVVFFAWLTATFATIGSPELNALLVAAVGLVSKFGIDALDYWLTPQPEVPHEQPGA
jgi:hypothetical protein